MSAAGLMRQRTVERPPPHAPVAGRQALPTVVQIAAPIALLGLLLAAWAAASRTGALPAALFPAPDDVARGFGGELSSGRLFTDVVASLFRVCAGFAVAVVCGIPLGLSLGHQALARATLLPLINFLRCVSPISWIPFAIFWFGVGDWSVVFLIFMATFPPLCLATAAAVANIPRVYFAVARDFGLTGGVMLRQVTLPAILPQVITSLRLVIGIAWVVVVAAEMIAGRDGLGFLIWDARNGLRTDLLVVGIVAIGAVGLLLDRLTARLTRLPFVRWGYER